LGDRPDHCVVHRVLSSGGDCIGHDLLSILSHDHRRDGWTPTAGALVLIAAGPFQQVQGAPHQSVDAVQPFGGKQGALQTVGYAANKLHQWWRPELATYYLFSWKLTGHSNEARSNWARVKGADEGTGAILRLSTPN